MILVALYLEQLLSSPPSEDSTNAHANGGCVYSSGGTNGLFSRPIHERFRSAGIDLVSAFCGGSGSSSVSCSQTVNATIELPGPLQGVPATVTVSGSVDASYGALFVTVSALLHPEGGWMEYAAASFSDVLTILGGSSTGYISYLFDGSFTSITDPGGGTSFGVQQNGLPGSGFATDTIFNINNEPFNYQTPLHPFTFGVPFTLTVSARTGTSSGVGDGFGQGTLSANLYNIAVLNQDHQPIPFTITAESGTIYPGQTPVPEPSSLLLGASVVALTGGVLRKRRSTLQLTETCNDRLESML